jgi:hypothetical protein
MLGYTVSEAVEIESDLSAAESDQSRFGRDRDSSQFENRASGVRWRVEPINAGPKRVGGSD